MSRNTKKHALVCVCVNLKRRAIQKSSENLPDGWCVYVEGFLKNQQETFKKPFRFTSKLKLA